MFITIITIIAASIMPVNRAKLVKNAEITIEGIVTVPPDRLTQGDLNIYVQDKTGGINVKSSDYDPTYNNFDMEETAPLRLPYRRYDLVRIKGIISNKKGEVYMEPVSEQILRHGDALKPAKIGLNELGNFYEEFVEIDSINATSKFPTIIGKNAFVKVKDAHGRSGIIYISEYSGIAGRVFPEGIFSVKGIVLKKNGQFCIFPSEPADIIRYEQKPHIIIAPYFSVPTRHSVIISWVTYERSSQIVEYGIAPDRLYLTATNRDMGIFHSIQLTGLMPGTKYYFKVISSNSYGKAVSPIRSFSTQKGRALNFTFVTMGDSRGSSKYNPLPTDTFKILLHLAAQRAPNFLLFAGDNVYGYCDSVSLRNEWENWLSIMDTLPAHSIPWYAVLGNHEATDTAFGTKLFQYYLSQNPDNGPSGLYYKAVGSFSYDNSHFDLLDSDPVHGTYTQTSDIDATEQNWLSQDLDTVTAVHIFAMQHKEAYPPTGSSHSSLENNPGDRDAFWHILYTHTADANIAAHIHLYNRDFFGRSLPDSVTAVHQIVDGSSGAPLVSGYGGEFYHYIYWEINGDTVRGYVYDVNNSLRDQFIWVKGAVNYPNMQFNPDSIMMLTSSGMSDTSYDTLYNDNGIYGGFNSQWPLELEAVRVVPEDSCLLSNILLFAYAPDTALDTIYAGSLYVFNNQGGYPGTALLNTYTERTLHKGEMQWLNYDISSYNISLSDTFWIGFKKTQGGSPYNCYDASSMVPDANCYYYYGWKYETSGNNYMKRAVVEYPPVPLRDTAYLTIYNRGTGNLFINSITHSHTWIQLSQTALTVYPLDSAKIEVIASTNNLSPGTYRDTLLVSSNDTSGVKSIPVIFSILNVKEGNNRHFYTRKNNTGLILKRGAKISIDNDGISYVYISLYDVNGRKIKIYKGLTEKKLFNIPQNIPEGMYILKIVLNKTQTSRKLVYIK